MSKRLRRLVIEEEDEKAHDSDDQEEEEILPSKEKQHELEQQPISQDDPNISTQNASMKVGHVEQQSRMEEEDEGPAGSNLPDNSEIKRLGDEEFIPELEEDVDPNSVEIEYPNKSSLVLNALIAALEDESNFVQRIALDFMYSHFKLNCDLFNTNEKTILVEATLRMLIRKDLSLTRRIYTWLFGPPDLENKYQVTEKNQ